MKANIIDTVNITKLEQLIHKYEFRNGEYAHYLIMNKKTFLKIYEEEMFLKLPFYNGSFGYDEYHGIPIAFCDKLALGEVEVL